MKMGPRRLLVAVRQPTAGSARCDRPSYLARDIVLKKNRDTNRRTPSGSAATTEASGRERLIEPGGKTHAQYDRGRRASDTLLQARPCGCSQCVFSRSRRGTSCPPPCCSLR